MDKEFELFLREKKFVQSVSQNTIEFYEYSYKALKKYRNVTGVEQLNKTLLMTLVANMRESGMSSGCTWEN